MITHDLKGPTTAIMMGSELALMDVKKMLRSSFKLNVNRQIYKSPLKKENVLSLNINKESN